MKNSIYSVNKGINKSIEFRGLKAQYIWYFAAMVIILMVVFAVMYIIGLSIWICLTLVGGCGALGTIRISALSHTHGEHGLMKAMAKRNVPKVLKSYGRKIFFSQV